MKKLFRYSLTVWLVVMLSFFVSCNDKPTSGDKNSLDTFTVTFICEGQEDVVYTVESGDILTEIPKLPTADGYTFAWADYDFSLPITEDIEITAVKTPNTYTVFLTLAYKSATIENSEISVCYGERYELPMPQCTGYKFVGWKIEETGSDFAKQGVYTLLSNVTLVAEWVIDETSSENWGDGF